jgi:phosphoadenosine phosphosulfate reductase
MALDPSIHADTLMTPAPASRNGTDPRIDYHGDDTPQGVLAWALGKFSPRIALASSFQHAILADMVLKIDPKARIFGIDTGRLPEETYECARAIESRYNTHIEWYFPKHEDVETMVRKKGVYSFKESLENRRECCGIRKVEPLNRALSGLDAWITGIRSDQGVTREEAKMIEVDVAHGGIIKINPLAHWSQDQIWDYVKEHNLPYNRLFDRGYTSIGCEPCTRPVQKGEDPRAGRWWWENAEHKECGLHVRNWNI